MTKSTQSANSGTFLANRPHRTDRLVSADRANRLPLREPKNLSTLCGLCGLTIQTATAAVTARLQIGFLQLNMVRV
ncbi:hypothetical protein KSP40_PGU011865 [Platanthera guangdongensis]|uniref:Uncharacterized protein n=1 Tax=Platanthera guangdongensis TaxID=2320717 RepID=A0ABR2MSL0_9ASPA